jgi:hypothetical protein
MQFWWPPRGRKATMGKLSNARGMQYWRPPRGRKEEFEKFGMLENFILAAGARKESKD